MVYKIEKEKMNTTQVIISTLLISIIIFLSVYDYLRRQANCIPKNIELLENELYTEEYEDLAESIKIYKPRKV